ncbi:MAG TPA: hypothetical protein VG871_01830, partial [Vicinamibacterales bacterium]|nr:hypothetical protein [Vicinamibacterales bacterium]
MSRRAIALAILAGLLLRVPGLFFNGMSDVFEFILDWGADVRALGLGAGFGVNYGVVSFAIFGFCARLAELMPRFWWVPFKIVTIGFELGVLLVLLRLCTPALTKRLLVAYWLNPWFIWHGAFQGFWEGPHLLLALLACLILRARDGDDWAWTVTGVLLCLSSQAKPQGLVHLAGPLGILLAWHFLRGRRAPLLCYSAGFLATAVALSAVLRATGGSWSGLIDNAHSTGRDVFLSRGGPGIWR